MINKVTRSIAIVLCAVILLLGSFISHTAHAEEGDSQSSSDIYYCREALKSLPNSAALLYAYDSIVSGVEASLESVSVYDGENAISVEEVNTVFDAYTRDHAEHFWLGKSYSVLTYPETVTELKPSYILSGDELGAAREDFESAVDELTSYVDGSMTDYEKELVLHDSLASRVVYEESVHAHDAYGALVEGKAVCEGYAEALQCLLHAVNVKSMIATGSSVNPSTNQSEGHAWNIVYIDGKYYHTDLTWNDQKSALYHAYFNLTDAVIKEDHAITEPAFTLPVCDSYDSNYFIKEGGFLTEYNTDTISQRLKNENLLTSVYISGRVDDFVNWYQGNIVDIAAKIGISGGFNYGYLKLGHEVILNIDACLHQTLSFVPEKSVSCTQDGNAAHYLCSCGRYFYDREAEHSVLSPEILFFQALGHSFELSEETEEFLRSEPDSCLSVYTYWHSCSRCGEISNTDYSQSDKRGPHSPGAPATTESPQLCTLCGDVLAPIIHTHVANLLPEVKPTCTEGGKKAYYTCECGKSFLDSDATKELLNPKNYGNLDALGHTDTDSLGNCKRCGAHIELFNMVTISVAVGAVLILTLVISLRVANKKKKSKNQ